MGILTAKLTIVGNRALLWNRFSPDALPLEKRPRTGVAGNDPDEWRKTVLTTGDGHLYLEPTYIFGCLRDAAKYTSRRRGTLQPILASTLQVNDARVLVDRWLPKDLENLAQAEHKPVYLDVRSVRNPATRGRNVRYRVAASPGWKTTFSLSWDDTLVSENEMRAVLLDAGRFVGLGDGRKIGLGRFDVLSFEITRNTNAEKKTAARSLGKNPHKNLEARQKKVRPLRAAASTQ